MTSKPKLLGKNITIGNNIKFGYNVIIYDNVEIKDNTVISHNCIIGDTDKKWFSDQNATNKKTLIGENCFIRPFSMISNGVTIGNNFQCGDKVLIRGGTEIGNNCSIGTLNDLQGDLKIGDYVRTHSNVHIGMKTEIEDYVWIYPYVVITNDPNPPMGKLVGSKIRKFSQIATMSVILPGIDIGEDALVGANSLVKTDVPEKRFFIGNPAKDICSVEDLRDINGNKYLPWKKHLKDFRGYPWQKRS